MRGRGVPMPRLGRRLIVLLALAMNASPVAACFEPSAPYCAERYGPFDDEWDFDRCKREMENYRDEVESYISCLSNEAAEAARRAASEAERQSQDAIDEYEDAVEGFNRRARG